MTLRWQKHETAIAIVRANVACKEMFLRHRGEAHHRNQDGFVAVADNELYQIRRFGNMREIWQVGDDGRLHLLRVETDTQLGRR